MAETSEKVILLAEDEASIAKMIETLLHEEGYVVVWAENGREGLKLLAELSQPPVLVLTDVMMPGMDAREMLRQMQANPTYTNIPVVIMSAATSIRSLDTLKYAAFLPKPFDLDELIAVINRVLSNQKSD